MMNAIRAVQHYSLLDSWVARLALLISKGEHPVSYGSLSLRLSFGLLWLGMGIATFFALRTTAILSRSDSFLKIFGGVVTVVGFPLVSGYVSFIGYFHMLGALPSALLNAYSPHRWLAFEVVASLICVFLYLFWNLPSRVLWGLVLLVLHFAIWTWVVLRGAGSGHILLWPGYDWTPFTREQPSLIYPWLGLLASLAWASYIRSSNSGMVSKRIALN